MVVFSSGTTGLPKGVCLSQYNLVANILQFATIEERNFHGWGEPGNVTNRHLGALPFFHIYVSNPNQPSRAPALASPHTKYNVFLSFT
jgi:long-subunit acyl-CoA synthetase (AMP-forming)